MTKSEPTVKCCMSVLMSYGVSKFGIYGFTILVKKHIMIRVITKLPNIEQSSKGKGKTHKSTNRQNQSTTGKLGKPQWP
jgi:hypothetical protein